MDAARAAVSKITGRTGHTTDVDEIVRPAVTSEVIKPHRHEETTQAIDREVHQDHYHTTVQPIQHREVIPEKHIHNIAPQIEKEYRHDNEDRTRRTVEAELGRFTNTSVTQQTTHSTQAAPTVTGEHVHHHVHETVQPIIHKETIQPEVVHTTIPVHEIHHASATHHGISALPMKSLDEFTRAGGVIGGTKTHTHEEYDGAPRPYNDKLTTTLEKVLPGHHDSSTIGSHGTTGTGLTGTHGSHNTSGLGTAGAVGGVGGVAAGSRSGRHGDGLRRRSSSASSSDEERRRRPDSAVGGVGSNTTKPSLMDKLNPRVDANRDGKAGFMK